MAWRYFNGQHLTLCTKVHVPINCMGVCSMTYKEDDIFVDEYLGKVDDDQLYTVAYIIDERRRGNIREFRVKWEVRCSRAQMTCSPWIFTCLTAIKVCYFSSPCCWGCMILPLEHDQADIGTLHRRAALDTCCLYMIVHLDSLRTSHHMHSPKGLSFWNDLHVTSCSKVVLNLMR